jgi:hypothetical protein
MGISFFFKKAIFTFRTPFSLSFAMKFQRRNWLEDFAWRVERVTQKFRLSSVSFLSVYLFSVTGMIAQLVERRASNPEVAL